MPDSPSGSRELKIESAEEALLYGAAQRRGPEAVQAFWEWKAGTPLTFISSTKIEVSRLADPEYRKAKDAEMRAADRAARRMAEQEYAKARGKAARALVDPHLVTRLRRTAPGSGRPRAQATRSSAKSGDSPSDDDGSDRPPRRLNRRRGGLRHISFAIWAFLAEVTR